MAPEIEESIGKFARLVREWTDIEQMFDLSSDADVTDSKVRRANKVAREYGRLALELAKSEKGRQGIEALMADPNPQVRSIAAVFAIQWHASGAVELEDVARLPGVVGLGAEYALKRHRTS